MSTTNYQPPSPEKNVAATDNAELQSNFDADKNLREFMETHKEFLDREIPWRDFYSNFVEFDRIRQRNADVRDAKTEYVEYEIGPLQAYLKKLSDLGFGYVDVYIGKYRDGDHQPSGDPIPPTHRKKITVMFAAKGTAFDFADPPLPYNVGDPHP